MSGTAVFVYIDFFTPLAVMVDQAIYTGKVDLMTASRFTLVGVVSRIAESAFRKNVYDSDMISNQTKNQMIVFMLNYIVSKGFDGRKVNHAACALRGVNADLMGKWASDSLIEDKALFSLP